LKIDAAEKALEIGAAVRIFLIFIGKKRKMGFSL
jgi:hypothetical protein